MRALWRQMANAYGSRFADQWLANDIADVMQLWAEELVCLHRHELTVGVNKLRSRQWPPTLPEFFAMCRPSVDPLVAYHEALKQGARRERGEKDVWTHPAIYWAWCRIGAFDMTNQPYTVLQRRWEATLGEEYARPDIQPVPALAIALPAPGKALMPPAKARAALAQLKHKTMRDGPAGDGRAWARKVLASGEGATLHCQKLAQAALERA